MNNAREVFEEKEEKEEQNIYINIIKGIIAALKFSLYICINILEILIKIIKVLFNINDYKPFQCIESNKISFLNRIAEREIDKEKIRFASDYLGRHEYTFPRSDTFLNCYKEIQQRLKDISDNNINLNRELYIDTIKQINALIVESEKQALKQGYTYAKETKYKLDASTVYEDFIQDKIMQGESNRKFKIDTED